MRNSLIVLLMLFISANVLAGWEKKENIYNRQFGYTTEMYLNYNADRTVALVIYKGPVKYEDPETKKIVSGQLITAGIRNMKENWNSSKLAEYGTIKINGRSQDIEFIVNSAQATATIIAKDGVNGDSDSQQLARSINNANSIVIDADNIGGKVYTFSK